MTTTLQQLQLWLQLFHNRYYIGVLSIEQEKQNNFLREIVEMYELSELWKYEWMTKIKQQLQKRIIFSNHSEIRQGNTNNPMRSFRMSLVIVDEQQFVENLDQQLKSIGPTLQTIQKSGIPWGIILNSTPNGVNNYYYQIYYNQLNNPEGNGYTVFKFHWRDVPYYNEEWYREQCEILGWDYLQIQQELELKFLSEQDTFIEPKVLEILQENVIEPVKVLKVEGVEIEIFEEPREGETYYLGVDVQSGLGQDYSQGVLINSQGEVCQVFHDKKQDDVELQKQINYLGKQYNWQRVGVEITGGFGLQVVRRLRELGYPNLFRMKKRDDSNDYVYGILTNQQTRPMILHQLQEYVHEFPRNIRSRKLINELLTLIYKNGKVQQKSGFHDDLQMQQQFAYFIRENSVIRRVYETQDFHLLRLLKEVEINEKTTVGGSNEKEKVQEVHDEELTWTNENQDKPQQSSNESIHNKLKILKLL